MTVATSMTYALYCESSERALRGDGWRRCSETFLWEGEAHGHEDALAQAVIAARAAGWTITQDHDGTVHVTCPGIGPRLPAAPEVTYSDGATYSAKAKCDVCKCPVPIGDRDAHSAWHVSLTGLVGAPGVTRWVPGPSGAVPHFTLHADGTLTDHTGEPLPVLIRQETPQ